MSATGEYCMFAASHWIADGKGAIIKKLTS
jgi:hypothetical protein